LNNPTSKKFIHGRLPTIVRYDFGILYRVIGP